MARAGKRFNVIIFCLLLILFIFFVGSPFYWALVTSFKTTSQITQMESLFWPEPFTIHNYGEIIFNTNFLKWYVNSMIVSVFSALISVCVGATAAYALIRLNFPGRRLLSSSVLMTYLIPPTILFIPFYLMFSKTHITDSIWSLVLAYPTFNIPFCTWILMGFFATIPKSIEEAARIDGANSLQIFGLICIPLMKPGIIAAIVFSFNLSWMEFLYALSFISSDYKKTLPVGLSELMIGDVIFWGPLMAGAVLTAFPVILLFIFLQRHFVTGLTAGSVKG